MANETSLAEIVLMVKDVKRAASFYRYAIGLSAQGEANDEWARFWTGAPETSPRIALHKGELPYEVYSPRPEGQRWGATHLALQVPAEKLEEALSRVRVQGIEVFGPRQVAWRNGESYYFYDFDGNLIEYCIIQGQK